jgi:hypothetical protein
VSELRYMFSLCDVYEREVDSRILLFISSIFPFFSFVQWDVYWLEEEGKERKINHYAFKMRDRMVSCM